MLEKILFSFQEVPNSLLCLEQPRGGFGLLLWHTVGMVALSHSALPCSTKWEKASGKPSRDG